MSEKETKQSTKPSKTQVVAKVPKKADKQRKIFLGWLHRPSKDSRFTQVRMKDGGSTRNLVYNDSESDSITIDFLTKQASHLFFPKGKSKFGMLEDMIVELGNFEEFKDTDGGKCTFKEYLKDRGLFASKFYVYLMTTAIEEESTAARVRQNDLCSTVSSYKNSLCLSTCNEVADLDI